MKKLLSTSIALAVTLSLGLAAPASAAGCVSSGDGSAGSPHVICRASDFVALQSATSGNYVLGADIDLSAITWSQNSNFDGTLDGAGHVVENLSIQSNSSTQVNGLFDDLQENAVVKNIRFKNASLNVNARSYAGILAYAIYGLVDNVQIEGTVVTNSGYTGGFSGQLNGGVISNSIANLNITDTVSSYVGGFSGTVDGTPTVAIGEIRNSLFIGTMTGGWASPFSLDGMPWWDNFNDPNPPMPTCDYLTTSYYLSTAASEPRGCGTAITPENLKAASVTTAGFTTWDESKWFFGSGVNYPQLKLFVEPPTQALFPSASAQPAGISLSWLTPIGDTVDGYDVQTRTATTSWVNAEKTQTAKGFTITGLANGTPYWVRLRSYNVNGKSDWNNVASAVTPIDVASLVAVSSAKANKSVLTVKWKTPTNLNGSNVANYTVGIFKTANASKPFKLVAAKNKLTALVKGLKVGTTVWVAVKAQNGAGTNSFGAKVKVKVVK